MKLVSHDLIQDITLRALSVIVLTSLIACLVFLGVRSFWFQRAERVEGPTAEVTVMPLSQAAPASQPVAAQRPEVLQNPGVIYRCVERGKVGYSDRPCGPESSSRPAR